MDNWLDNPIGVGFTPPQLSDADLAAERRGQLEAKRMKLEAGMHSVCDLIERKKYGPAGQDLCRLAAVAFECEELQ